MGSLLDLDDLTECHPAARAELEALRKNSERWRFLRDRDTLTWQSFRRQWRMDSALCDATIDAEIARMPVGAA